LYFPGNLPLEMQDFFTSIETFERTTDAAQWQWTRAGSIEANADDFRRIIEKKNAKVGNYRKEYSAIWLVINGSAGCCVGIDRDTDTFATCSVFNESLLEVRFDTRFQRILFYDFMHNIHELQVLQRE
jgi:hypothetical protein